MEAAEDARAHLTDYERAVCYYALPKVRNPVTFGLIVAFGVCLLESLGAVAYGLFWDSPRVMYFGIYAFAGLTLFGVIVFFCRALIADIRSRKLLSQARNIPDAPADLGDLPNPFESHLLLRRALANAHEIYRCDGESTTLEYRVEPAREHGHWTIASDREEEPIRVKVLKGPASFQFTQDLPRCLGIYRGETEIGQICRRFSFDAAVVMLEPASPTAPRYTIRRSGIYLKDRLVGRLYHLRDHYYLDVERASFHPLLAAYFATVS